MCFLEKRGAPAKRRGEQSLSGGGGYGRSSTPLRSLLSVGSFDGASISSRVPGYALPIGASSASGSGYGDCDVEENWREHPYPPAIMLSEKREIVNID